MVGRRPSAALAAVGFTAVLAGCSTGVHASGSIRAPAHARTANLPLPAPPVSACTYPSTDSQLQSLEADSTVVILATIPKEQARQESFATNGSTTTFPFT